MRFLSTLALLFLSSVPVIAQAANDALLREIVLGAKESESHSLVIIEGGQTIYSDFFGGRDELRSVQSVTKSVSALAIAILLDEGKIASLDLPMSTWIPAWASHPQKSKITLRMILNHTSGLPDIDSVPGFWLNQDVVSTATGVALTAEPGTRFLYSNIGASLLQPVIAQSAGKTVFRYVRDKLFGPLGIRDVNWRKDKAGHEVTSGGLFLRTRDLVKIGALLLAEGRWGSRVLIRPDTLKIFVGSSQPFFPYGLMFWLDQAANGKTLFSARGWGGQYILVYPDKKLVVVRTKDPQSIAKERRNVQGFPRLRELTSRWE